MSNIPYIIRNARDAGDPMGNRILMQDETWPTLTLEPIIVQNYRPSSVQATRGYEFDEIALDRYAAAIYPELPPHEVTNDWTIDGLPSYVNDNLMARLVRPVDPHFSHFHEITSDPYNRDPRGDLIVYIEPTWDNRYVNRYEALMDNTPSGSMGIIQFTTMVSHIEAPHIQFSALDLFTGLMARSFGAYRVLQQLVRRENVLPRPETRFTANHYFVRHVVVKSLQPDSLDTDIRNRDGITSIEMMVAIRWSDPHYVHIVAARPCAINDQNLTDFSQYTVYNAQDTTWDSVRRYFQRIDKGWPEIWAMDIGVDMADRDIWIPQQWHAQTAWGIYCDHIRRVAGIDVIPDAWWDMSLSRVKILNIRYLSLELQLYNEIPQRQIWDRGGKLAGYTLRQGSSHTDSDGDDHEQPVDGAADSPPSA